jgi:type VI secretion system protein ImpJ
VAAAFPAAQNKAVLLLAVPPERSGARNYALEPAAAGSNGSRFAAEQRVLVDENNGSDERAVRVGRKNIRLMLDTEDPHDAVCLPVARIMRSGSGRFVLDPSYIPPCLDITAASRLLPMLGRLVRSLDDRAASLRSTLNEARGTSPRELTRFWFLHTLNAAVAPLRHIYNARRGHPEQLYLEMSRLAGALCTFLLESHPRGLPLYDHRNLEACFDALDAHIRRHIEIVIQENCLRIPLPQTAQYFFGAEITDPRCLSSSSWILSVRGGGPEVDVISKVPGLVKVCSEAFVPELVKRALPGFVLTHLPSPPPAVPATPAAQYFQINRAGPCWEHIRTSKRVGAYVPGDLPNPELELLVVIE